MIEVRVGEPPRRSERSNAIPAWRGLRQPVDIGGRHLASPMTYVTEDNQRGRPAEDPSQLDSSLKVAATPAATELPYWPWYARMNAGQRAAYLDWMAAGREQLPPTDGYLFVFYYGLERRALVDKKDLGPIVREVARLRFLHGEHAGQSRSWSFQHYSSAFLWFLVARHAESFSIKDIQTLAEHTASWRDDALRAALAWCVAKQQPCPTWLAQAVADALPQTPRSVVTKRVPEEFTTLFAKRYRERFGDGIVLKVSKRPATVTYTPASAALDPFAVQIPDALGIPSQFKPLAEIFDACVADLRALSRIANKGETEALTVEAWEALPPELRKGSDHPLTAAACKIIAEHTSDDGGLFVPVGKLAALLGIEDRSRYTPTQSRRIAETLAAIGYDLEPDARLDGAYRKDQLVAPVIRLVDAEPDAGRYLGASTMLRLGLSIAAADGEASDVEVELITEEIERLFDMPEHEERRLEALRKLLLHSAVDAPSINAKVRDSLDPALRQAMGDLLIAVAAVDGRIDPGERKALRQCFRALGLEPTRVDARLRDLATAETTGNVESADIALDRDAIRAIREETRQVAHRLAEAMGESQAMLPDDSAEPAPADNASSKPLADPVAPTATISDAPAGLPPRYAGFYAALAARADWTRDDLEGLARSHGHMLAGALEAINDWAFEIYDAPLIHDDGDTLFVDTALLGEAEA